MNTVKVWPVWVHYSGEWHLWSVERSEKRAKIEGGVGVTHHRGSAFCVDQPLMLVAPLNLRARQLKNKEKEADHV